MNEEWRQAGGDPACWLDQVCDACGRIQQDADGGACEHCGARADQPLPADRDRDAAGRARNARPRDGLGRPLPYGAAGVARQPEGVRRSPQQTLTEAQRLLDTAMPFHAHEVLEDAWKTAETESERALWRALAQLAVGLTHAARGNASGAVALLRRAADGIAPFQEDQPYGIDVVGLTRWAQRLADDLGTKPAGAVPARLTAPRLRRTPREEPPATPPV